MAKGVQGVKVVNPMMGGDFDVPVDDDEDDLEVPLSPQVANAAEGVQTALGDAGEAAVETTSKVLLSIQAFVTFVFFPLAFFWLVTVLIDILAFTKHERLSLEFAVMVVFPALSFWGSVYMLVQYWLDQDSWTLLRKRVMFANVPMCIFFGLVLAGQSEFHKMGMTCPQMAGILQVVYLMMNLWHTMTIITAYRFIILGRGRLVGFSRFLIHVVCWGFPIASTTAMYMLDNDVFHTDIFTDPDMVEAGGMAWCGVKSDKRVLKAIFVNTPQLVSVSLYAQYYSYIHEKVDPPEDTDPINKSTKLALSKNAALMGASAKRIAQYYQDVALQLRLYMTAYMLSFLTNTVIQLVGDNMALGPPSRANLIAQAIVVTPQGFLWALVYSRTAPNSLFEAYCNVAIKYFESKGNTPWAARFKGFRDGRATGQLAEKAAQLAADKAETDKATGMKCLGLTLGVWLQTFLMLPVGVWVWAPMGFLAEMMTSRFSVFLGLLVWGISTVFPFYWFRQGQVVCQSYADALESGSEYPKCEWFALIAQAFLIWVVGVSAFGVWKSRYLYHLNMIEGPVRRKGIFSSIGEGIRVNSVRNTMGIFTSVLEFYQTWGLTWQTGKMDDRYDPCLNPETIDEPCLEASGSAADFEEDGSMGDDGEEIQDSSAKNVRMYWLVVGMVGGWCFFYALPSVITTVSIKNRKASYNLTEAYRKYLWFMSGAGFLTILKALMLVLFCRPDPYEVSPCVFNATAVAEHKEASNETIGMGDPRVCSSGFAESNMTRLVPMTTNHMECWEPKHLQMVTISLLCLLIFFPSASLTCLFRYGDEDDRGCFKKADENGQFGEGSKPCVGGCLLGGEDCRWIHIWRRAEYMVKGVWVFSAYKFSSYSNYQEVNPGVIFLLAGSATITWLNFFMHPCNLSYFGRWKFLIHSCNTWTTITCLIVIGDNSRDKVAHFGMLYAGWAFIIGSQLIYEGWNFKTDVFRQEIGDEENIDKSKKDIASLKKSIINARSLKRWGVHSQITRLIRFAEHPDAPVQQEAFRAIASLAYNDQMTGGSMVPGTSNFMFITPVDPTVEAFLMTIEGRDRNGDPVTDLTTRNLATQCLLTFLQANVWNKYGALVSYYEAVEDYTMKAEADGRSVVQAFVTYIGECEDREHQIDALILLLNFCKVDTNHLVKVCDVALPLLQERIQSGELIEQFVAIQIISMVSERFDLAAKLIDTLIIKDVIDLFHMAMDQYKYNEMVDNGATKFEKSAGGGKCAPLTNSLTVPGHNLPIKLKELFIGEASRRNKEEFPEDLTLGEPELKKLMHQLMVNTISCVVECAGAVNHAGRRHLIDMGALAIMKRCFEFKDGATEDAGIIHDLQEEALRAAHAFMCGPFAERDIEVDPDFKMFDGMIMRFKEKAEASEPEPDFVGDGGLGADTKLTLEFDSTLTPLQRRKAHIMCEYHRLEHASIGVGIDRRVAAYAVTESLVKQDNPMDEKDDDVADIAAVPDMAEKPDYYSNDPQVNFDWNYEQVGKLDLDTKLLALQEANVNDPTGKVMFHVVDLMLLTLEHDMVPDHARDTYRTVMLDNISSPDVGMAVMGATGAEIFCVKDGVYAEYGERKEKYWPRGPLRMFKWAGRMVYWIWFWKIHSGSLGFLTPEEELAAKEEAEANDQETKFAEPALKQANPMDENME